jgi:hypothetical protein
MTSEPENIVLEQLRLLRADIARIESKFDVKFDDLTHKMGMMAQTLVAVQRDLKEVKRDVSVLKDTVGTFGIAVDEHTIRLDRLESRQPPA